MNSEKYSGTQTANILKELDAIYNRIEVEQTLWKRFSPQQCVMGCGLCCVDFEPDVLECESIYMAAWIIENMPETAQKIEDNLFNPAQGVHKNGCFLFDPSNPYHCTVYEGRALICRLFGYSGDKGKDGKIRWSPCKFNNSPLIAYNGNKMQHRQYTEDELEQYTGYIPPVMADAVSQALSLLPDTNGRTYPLREILPLSIRKLKMILKFLEPPEPNSPEPNTPLPLSA